MNEPVSPNKIGLRYPLDNPVASFWKRVFDLLFSFLVLLFLLWWFIPLLCLIIVLDSKGWPIFRQKRTGHHNKEFWCWKLRTMVQNPDADSLQATDSDPRITRIGAWLRKTNMDELPQFWNVFLGQMSVVGPRPHMLKHTDEYSQLIDRYMDRHHVRPGVTGWAQVNGFHGETKHLWKMERRILHDLDYIEHWSFAWDLSIIWKTMCCKWLRPDCPMNDAEEEIA